MAGFNLSKCVSRGGAAAHMTVAAAFTLAWLVPNSTESAVANGDTRTVILSDQHTNESGSFTFMVNGVYDQAVLDKLNWFCRDWRLNEPTKMDPHLFDIIWEVYRESGSSQPIDVLSGYRSPQTNAMLRRRSRQVAEHSQHMQGKAIDAHFLDVSTARIRDIAMRAQTGGVGFYPTGNTPWVHIDSGSVRYWPKMSRDALTRLFPDGKTVFIPADGQPMPRYEEARAEIEARGGNVQVASGGGIGGIFSWLFGGGGADDAEEFRRPGSDDDGGVDRQRARRPKRRPVIRRQSRRSRSPMSGRRRSPRPSATCPPVTAYASAPEPALRSAEAPEPQASADVRASRRSRQAKRNLPTGPTYASAPESAPTPPVKPQAVAELEQPNVASDASPEEPRSSTGPKFIAAPLPPRKPADLAALAFADAPMPPTRPADLILVSKTDTGQGGAAFIPLSNKAFGPAVPRGSLPTVITSGVDRSPTGALALAYASSAPKYDDDALLARAAELTAPLPPMPIANLAASNATMASADSTAVKPQQHGWVARTAALAAEDIAQLFGGAFKTSSAGSDRPRRTPGFAAIGEAAFGRGDGGDHGLGCPRPRTLVGRWSHGPTMELRDTHRGPASGASYRAAKSRCAG